MLKLKRVAVDDDGTTDVQYEAVHVAANRNSRLALEVDVRLMPRVNRMEAKVVLAPGMDLEGADVEAALDKLADWAERLAQTLRNRGPATTPMPVFNSPVVSDEPADEAA